MNFKKYLHSRFISYRDFFRKNGICCHGRVPETIAQLEIGMEYLLRFFHKRGGFAEDWCRTIFEKFQNILTRLARNQSDSIDEDKPTHKFICKIYALLESNQAHLLDRNDTNELGFGTCVGYQDTEFLYLYSELTHKLVRKLCEDQGENFSCSQKSLLKALAEEGLIEPGTTQNTRPLRIGEKQKRVIFLYREKAERIRDTAS